MTRDLVSQSRRVQFVLTSHHPYIVNNVSTRNWKIVTRKGSVVTAINTTGLGLESSSHQSLIKLMNLPEYIDGIADERGDH